VPNEYQKEDVRMRLAFERSRGCLTIDTIAKTADCTLGEAWKLAIVREHASGVLLDAWAKERITWRKLWRLVTDNPLDTEAQAKSQARRKSPKKTHAHSVVVIDESPSA
jgi:dihydroorotase-like cyclic amidohydrolase